MAFLIKTVQFLAALFIMVGMHELGHLLFAKLFKMRVNSYMIGFPPKIFKIKWGETEYSLGSIPLGGAVQIAGMVDESLDTNHLQHSPQPWEFRSKPAWQRLIAILGGIIFNLISAIFIWIGLTYMMGYNYLPKDEVNKYGIIPSAIGSQMGFKIGDQIIQINGKDFEDFNDILSPNLLLRSKSYYTIERAGKLLELPIPEKLIEDFADLKKDMFIRPIYPCFIQEVAPGSNAAQAGLMDGDQIIEVAGQSTLDIGELRKIVKASIDTTVKVAYLRDGRQMSTAIQVSQQGLGIQLDASPYRYKNLNYSFIASIPIGLGKTWDLMQAQFLAIWKLITGKLNLKNSLSGPIGIAQSFGNEFIGYRFWMLVASLSIAIAVINLLPIPALDGGHALCILYEAISGRKPSDRFLKTTQKLGMILILLLTFYALSNDIRKLL
ncbi:MAG: RIP metalloprotease RseP [Candidatus Cardinium sp.]|uniref:RIP metalloprotease RseP n=1 Tax=Cardinium endosymbiont of Dermatophagoides farinae TaxID=2597823 RepID=UPI0011836B6A|nr:RIP metalloprotease RseP [Cardinium endosymbiont of Dermatophagoides farinae]TSJ80900.1 RIP metalloprotease RseP [Cardinium endosymbiont of Dermatophagoides farinae]UWW96912.1 MAG: RIP metalloprotease RseP [Candidatus Cardinium sp.]